MSKHTEAEISLLQELSSGAMQYGECHGVTLDSLLSQGLAVVGDEASGLQNGFIARGTSLMYRAVSITAAGVDALPAETDAGEQA